MDTYTHKIGRHFQKSWKQRKILIIKIERNSQKSYENRCAMKTGECSHHGSRKNRFLYENTHAHTHTYTLTHTHTQTHTRAQKHKHTRLCGRLRCKNTDTQKCRKVTTWTRASKTCSRAVRGGSPTSPPPPPPSASAATPRKGVPPPCTCCKLFRLSHDPCASSPSFLSLSSPTPPFCFFSLSCALPLSFSPALVS